MTVITKPTIESSTSNLLNPSFEIHFNILLSVAESVELHSDYCLLSVFLPQECVFPISVTFYEQHSARLL